MTKAINYKLTVKSSFVAIFVQAIITNLTAILFIPMMSLYNLSYIHLGMLVAINFSSQVAADIIFSGMIDKLGYKKLVLPTTIIAFTGLMLFGLAPNLFPNNVFTGVVIATVVFAMASGLLEVLISPMINAVPGDDKASAMSLLHSFYAWGQVVTIIVTTVFLFIFGKESWQVITFIWALVPLVNFVMFIKSPFPPIIPEEHRLDMKDLLFKPFYILALFAIFFGAASEVTMNQWSSTFMEKALSLPKITGDLVGMCGFAVTLGIGRMIYGIYGARLKLINMLIIMSSIGVVCYIGVSLSPINGVSVALCAICGFAVSLMWPGTLIIASERYPLAGAWMFAILAAAGDIGAATGPWLTGKVVDSVGSTSFVAGMASMLKVTTEQASIRTGILVATLFPIMTLLCHIIFKRSKQSNQSG